MEQNKLTIGDIILNELERDPYFRALYKKLLRYYGEYVFDIERRECAFTEKELTTLLQAADLFSKSNATDKLNFHRNIAQEIVIMLSLICCRRDNPFYEKIVAVEDSVLKNVSNYAGLGKLDQSIRFKKDYFSAVAEEALKNLNRVKSAADRTDDNNEYFSDSQRVAIYNLLNRQYYSFSAPTSMGKTYIISNFLSRKLSEEQTGCIALVLPTKALINEIEEDLIDKYENQLKSNNYVIITIPDQIKLFSDYKKILVFTPERLLQALNENQIESIDYLFIDEAQKIFEKDNRAPLYYKIIDLINATMPLTKIFFSSPYAKNPDELLKLITTSYKENRSELAKSDVFDFSPVSQKQFIVDCENGSAEIINSVDNGYEQIYSGKGKCDWRDLITEQTKKGTTIVYCKSRSDAVRYAKEYADRIEGNETLSPEVESLIKKLKDEINEDYYLISVLRKGVAFHIGIMPAETRKSIENIVKKKQGINVIFCTSTLLEGVNLPAVNIFILSYRKSRSPMSVLEFKNLIGRAGRIRYSLWGNAFLLNIGDEKAPAVYKGYFAKTLENDRLVPEVTGYINEMVSSLFDNGYEFEKKSSYSDLARFIMFRNLLAEAIINRKTNSPIYKKYEYQINRELAYGKSIKDIDVKAISDLQFAPEIIQNISEAVENGGITLPDLKPLDDIGEDKNIAKEERQKIMKNNEEELLLFFKKLYSLYQWDVFEDKRDIGSYNSLWRYANLTAHWIAGQRLGVIILSRISYYREKGERLDPVTRKFKDYRNTIQDKNEVIMEVMDEIENILKFKISNYVSKFIAIYKKEKNLDNSVLTVGDYIDYGTMNGVVISFQKMGLSRELSKEIYNYGLYTAEENRYIIKNEAELMQKTKYKEELLLLSKNLRGIFKVSS